MKKFHVNGKSYFTICSIHEEIRNIFRNILKIDFSNYKNAEELYIEILRVTELGMEFSNVATEMGQHMEDGLSREYRENSYGYYSNIYNSNQFNLFDEVEEEN
jgi:hypothetical protein